jgi:uncharacterized protein with ATP-grasp and redox domains
MKTYLECIPCFFKQALFAARAVTDDERDIKRVLDKIAKIIPDIPLNNPPPETGRLIHTAIRVLMDVHDPFKTYKDKSIKSALRLYGALKSEVEQSEDPLRTAVAIAIAGNVIDPGANQNFDLEGEMKDVMERPLSIDHYESFKRSMKNAQTVLYIGDNAGETVFDRILIETFQKNTIYAVRDIPIINDVTVENAQKSGIDRIARIISSGCGTPGTILKRCSPEFIDIFRTADIIVSKGQGNFEGLSDEKGRIFFLLKVKCKVVARNLQAEEGGMILKNSRL